MFFTVTVFIVLFVFFLAALVKFYRLEKVKFNQERLSLLSQADKLQSKNDDLAEKITQFDTKISHLFAFYDTARTVAPIFKKERVVNTFIAKLNSMEEVTKASLKKMDGQGCHEFPIGEEDGSLYLETKSFDVLGLAPIFAQLLSVCFQRLRLYGRLQELSVHDYLTGIYNRRYFDRRLGEEFNRASELKHKLSFLMIDIDNFKKVNDTYGHLVGDAVLQKCASLILEGIREIDFVGRLGGEEFGVLLLDTDKAGAIMVAERICFRISQERMRVFDERLAITVSVGIATYPSNTIYLDLLGEIADKALYRAKASGKDKVCWF